MEQQRKSIDDLFREELGGYAETPPSSAWEAFERKLDAAPPRAGGLFDRWSAYIGAACLLLLLSVTVAVKMNNSTPGTLAVNTGSNNTNYAATPATTGTGKLTADNSNTKNIADKPGNTTSAAGNNNALPTSDNNNTATTTHSNHIVTNANKPLIRTTNHNKGNHGNNNYAANTKHSTGNSKANNTTNGSSASSNNDQPATANVYNSSPGAHSGPSAGTEEDATEKKEVKATPDVPKKETPAAPKPFAKKEAPKKPSKPPFKNFFEAGVKVGYETGFNNDASKKAVASAYVEYHISPKFALMLQPAFKAASLSTRRIGSAESYYKVNDDGKMTKRNDSDYTPVPGGNGWVRYYDYSQTHDSIVKTYTIGGTSTEIDLPIMLKYNIVKNFSVYGGVNITYNKTIGITQNTYTKNNILKTGGDTTFAPTYDGTPTPKSLSQVITYSGTPYPANYIPTYTSVSEGQFRVGYMVGFSYQCTNRLLLDALIQQATATPNVQAGYNVNSALAAPYVRFTVGYKLLTK